MAKRENDFQANLILELYDMFPGCLILKNDANYLQGILDLTILWKKNWAMLECKRGPNEPFRPNQEYYLDWADSMSFGACIFPENKEEVLDALQHAFRSRRSTCLPKRQ